MSDSDGYEAHLTYYENMPRRTHKVMCLGEHIGDVWDNVNITVRDDTVDTDAPTLDEISAAIDADILHAPQVCADHDD